MRSDTWAGRIVGALGRPRSRTSSPSRGVLADSPAGTILSALARSSTTEPRNVPKTNRRPSRTPGRHDPPRRDRPGATTTKSTPPQPPAKGPGDRPDAMQGHGYFPNGLCSIVVVDIAGFSDPARTDSIRHHLKLSLLAMVDDSLSGAGIGSEERFQEDRGDGILLVLPPHHSPEILLTHVVGGLRSRLRRYNRTASNNARLRLRVGLDQGVVKPDGGGLVGHPLINVFRMVDAPSFKRAMRRSDAQFGLIISERVYEDAVRATSEIDQGGFRKIAVPVKESRFEAWTDLQADVSPEHPAGQPSITDMSARHSPPRQGLRSGAGTPNHRLMQLAFELVELLVDDSPLLTSEARDQVVDELPETVRLALPRANNPYLDVYSIVQSCLQLGIDLRVLQTILSDLFPASRAMISAVEHFPAYAAELSELALSVSVYSQDPTPQLGPGMTDQ